MVFLTTARDMDDAFNEVYAIFTDDEGRDIQKKPKRPSNFNWVDPREIVCNGIPLRPYFASLQEIGCDGVPPFDENYPIQERR